MPISRAGGREIEKAAIDCACWETGNTGTLGVVRRRTADPRRWERAGQVQLGLRGVFRAVQRLRAGKPDDGDYVRLPRSTEPHWHIPRAALQAMQAMQASLQQQQRRRRAAHETR